MKNLKHHFIRKRKLSNRCKLLKSFLLMIFFLPAFISSAQISVSVEAIFPGSADFPPLRPKTFCTKIKYEVTVTNTSPIATAVSINLTGNNQDGIDIGQFQNTSTFPNLSLDLINYEIAGSSTKVFTVCTRINTAIPFSPDFASQLVFDAFVSIDGVSNSTVTDGLLLLAITAGATINGTGAIPATVSALINAELFPVDPGPLSNNTASNSNQNIQLSGVLWIDVPEYWFTFAGGEFDPNAVRSEINMEEGAEIIVKSGSILHLGAQVTSCGDQMWKSITVEDGATLYITHSLIEGGQYGILAHDGANVIVQHTTFHNNYVGIKTPKSVNGMPNDVNFTLYGNTFTSDGNLNDPYPNQVPIPENLPFAGIDINNVPFMSVNYTPFHKTTFSNLANGIVSNSSTLTLGNVDFLDIQKLPNTTYPFSGRGISAKSNSLLHTLTHSGNAFGDSNYENCDIGVYAENINTTLFDLTMNKVRIGVHLEKNNSKVLRVNDNTINSTHTAVFLNNNSFNYLAEVKNNIISVDNPTTSGFGIRGADVINITTDGFGWDIENNFIDISNNLFGTGIHYDMGSFNNYIGNSINTDIGNFDKHLGFRLEGGANNRVLCNSFNGNASATSFGSGKGYFFNGIYDSDISCNEASNVDMGMVIFAMSNDILLRGNNISDTGTGLQLGLDTAPGLGNTFIGEQPHHGNMWEPDADLSDNNFGAVHLGNNPSMIIQSVFDVNPEVIPPVANRTFLPSIATPNSSETWFNIEDGIAPFNCNTENTCPEGIGYHGLVNDDDDDVTKLDELIATQNLSTDGYDVSMTWMAKRHLFQKLKTIGFDDSEISTPSDQLMASFYSAEINTSVGQFYNIDESINDLLTLDISNESSLLSQRNTFDEKINALENLETEIHSDDLSENQLLIKMAEKENLLLQLISLDENGISFSELISNQKKAAIEDVLEDNALITSSTVYESNEKDINQIYLNNQLKLEDSYFAQDVITIERIANQCPLTGGDAVYKARAIMASINPNQTFDDLILCRQDDESKRLENNEEKQITDIKIQPNPASDIFEVFVSTTEQDLNDDPLIMIIYNSIGQKILEREIKYEVKERIDVENFGAGIYTVTIRNRKGVLLQSSKAIVFSK